MDRRMPLTDLVSHQVGSIAPNASIRRRRRTAAVAAAEGTIYFFVGPRLSALFSFTVGVVILYFVCLCEAQNTCTV